MRQKCFYLFLFSCIVSPKLGGSVYWQWGRWRVQWVPLGLLWKTQLLAQVSGWESQKEDAQQQRGGGSGFSCDSLSFIWAFRASMNLQRFESARLSWKLQLCEAFTLYVFLGCTFSLVCLVLGKKINSTCILSVHTAFFPPNKTKSTHEMIQRDRCRIDWTVLIKWSCIIKATWTHTGKYNFVADSNLCCTNLNHMGLSSLSGVHKQITKIEYEL